jgi:translocation and assembly module TamA
MDRPTAWAEWLPASPESRFDEPAVSTYEAPVRHRFYASFRPRGVAFVGARRSYADGIAPRVCLAQSTIIAAVCRIVSFSACALRWLCALTLAATLALPPAHAAEADGTSEAAYRVVVDAPNALKAPIESSLGLVRWQRWPDMTLDLADRLAREAIEEAKNAAAAEGYFSARVEIAVDRSVRPAVFTVTVVPGEPTRVSDVRIDVSGPATEAAAGTAAIARARNEWALPRGDIFRQSQWTIAKEQALAALRRSPYAAAKIAKSEADIDPDARSAELSLALESGPAFRFGELVIDGLSKYRPEMVRNYRSFAPGDPYSDATLEQFVRRLNGTGYFSSVQAAIDIETDRPDDAPVRVAVIEAPTKRLELGVGYSTDVRYTAKIDYRDVDIDRDGLQLLVNGQLDTKTQSGSMRFVKPANEAGWIATLPFGYERTDIEGLATRTAFAGTRWYTVEERRERAYSATFYVDEQQPDNGAEQRSHALYVEAEQYWRNTDSLTAPSRGVNATVHLGGGVPGASTRGFGRVIGRIAAWVPLDPKLELELRADAGAVLAPTRDGIPSPLLFRTGGDTTVRGYAFQSLGVKEGTATVGGRYYAVASAELIRWVNDVWGIAVFADTGNAADSLPDFRFVEGYGAGVRVRTPLGPFRLDVAYGQEAHKVRLHFSVGLSF